MQVGRDMPLRCLALLFPAYSPATPLPVVTSTSRGPSLPSSLQSSPCADIQYARLYLDTNVSDEESRRRVRESRSTRRQGVTSLSLYCLKLGAMQVATYLGAVQKMGDERSLRNSALR